VESNGLHSYPTGTEISGAGADRCPVCGAEGLPFVRRDAVPVHQNQLCSSASEARSVVRGDLRICHCDRCDFVWNAAFDLSLLSYDHDYDNTQSCSPRFAEHLRSLVAEVVEERGVRGKRIVEVGCGQGEILRALVAADDGNTGHGFDPSHRGPLEELGGRLRFEHAFYGPDQASGAADVVLSRHVIEHVDTPVEMLALMRGAIEAAPDPRFFLETPDVAWILEGQVVWDFFYEHCSYFTCSSLDFAAQRAGLALDRLDLVFGAQYMWAEGRPATRVAEPAPTSVLRGAAEEFERAERRLWERLRGQLDDLSRRGPVAVWGAGAKGVTFANELDPQAEILAAVIDLNPAKQGGFLPGTGHPIVSPQEANARGIASAVLLNPNYEQEIVDVLADEQSSIDLVAAAQVDAIS
jgi:hypothetical protein